jgi:hypothetical protein
LIRPSWLDEARWPSGYDAQRWQTGREECLEGEMIVNIQLKGGRIGFEVYVCI